MNEFLKKSAAPAKKAPSEVKADDDAPIFVRDNSEEGEDGGNTIALGGVKKGSSPIA